MLTSGPGLPYPMLGLALLSSRTQSGSGMPLPLGLVSVLGGQLVGGHCWWQQLGPCILGVSLASLARGRMART